MHEDMKRDAIILIVNRSHAPRFRREPSKRDDIRCFGTPPLLPTRNNVATTKAR